MAITYSNIRKPVNSQVIDPKTGAMREEWFLYFDGLTKRLNGAVGELGVDLAPADAAFVTNSSNAALTNELVLGSSTSVTKNDSVPGSVTLERAALTGDVTASANSNTTEIANDAVTFSKIQNIATDRLIGRDTASTGDPEEISVGGGLEFTGSAGIQRSALTGDVTSSAGSNSTTIPNDTVTYAKMQNISATSRILGRKTSGAGDTEECTLSEVLDFIGSAAQGDILYRGASAWARLAAGSTNRQRLLTGGASANPSWGGGIVTLASGSLPAAANFDITDIPSIYTSLILHVVNISHNSGSNQRPIIQLSTNNGSSFSTTEYRNSGVNASGAGAITAPATDNMISEPSSGTGNSSAQWIATVHLFNYAGGVFPFYMSGLDRVGTNHYLLNGRFTSTTAVNAIRVAFSGGSIDAGTYALYGAL